MEKVHFKNPRYIPAPWRDRLQGGPCASTSPRSRAYLVVLVLVGDLESVHGSDHSLHGREDVLIHQLGEAPFVFIGVP